MSLTDEQIKSAWDASYPALPRFHSFARAIESAATAPLLDRIAELERELEAAKSELSRPMSSEATLLVHDNARLRRELEAVRKDAERLDAIEKNCRTDPKMDGNHVYWPTTWKHSLKGPNLRAAIDAARTRPE